MPRQHRGKSPSPDRRKKSPGERIHRPEPRGHEAKEITRNPARGPSAKADQPHNRHAPPPVPDSQYQPSPRLSLDSGIGSSPTVAPNLPRPRERLPLISSGQDILPTPGQSVRGRGLPPQPALVTSKLSLLGREFADIRFGELTKCQEFITKHPQILKDAPTLYVGEALSALRAENEKRAASCIQQSLLLRDCIGCSSGGIAEYFDDLRDRQNDEQFKSFMTDFEQAMERLRHRALIPDPVPQPLALPGGMAPLNKPTSNRYDAQLSIADNGRRPFAPSRTYHNTNVEVRPARTLSSRSTMSSGVSDGQSYYGPEEEIEQIDERYKVYNSDFFTLGKVFATLWHASYGDNHDRKPDSRILPRRFQENVISHIQRMVVVKEEHGCCWCVPINTYGRRGVKKFAMRKPSAADQRDIDAHAIIHMSTQQPASPEWEPKMVYDPISVKAAGNDQELHVMSRVNFAKIHTLEHNVKVMHVGKVVDKCMKNFIACWRKKALEHPTRAGRE